MHLNQHFIFLLYEHWWRNFNNILHKFLIKTYQLNRNTSLTRLNTILFRPFSFYCTKNIFFTCSVSSISLIDIFFSFHSSFPVLFPPIFLLFISLSLVTSGMIFTVWFFFRKSTEKIEFENG